MPINRKEIEEQERREEPMVDEAKKEIIKFLQNNLEEMFTYEEISEAVKYPESFQDYNEDQKRAITIKALISLDFSRKIEGKYIKNAYYYGMKK